MISLDQNPGSADAARPGLALDAAALAARARRLLADELADYARGEARLASSEDGGGTLTEAITRAMVDAAHGEPVPATTLHRLGSAGRAAASRGVSTASLLRAAELIAALVWQAGMDAAEVDGPERSASAGSAAAKLSLSLLDASTLVSTALASGSLGVATSSDTAVA